MSIQTENRIALLEETLDDLNVRLRALEDKLTSFQPNDDVAQAIKKLKDDVQGIKMRAGRENRQAQSA